MENCRQFVPSLGKVVKTEIILINIRAFRETRARALVKIRGDFSSALRKHSSIKTRKLYGIVYTSELARGRIAGAHFKTTHLRLVVSSNGVSNEEPLV